MSRSQRDPELQAIIIRYARRTPHGVQRCRPSKDELTHRTSRRELAGSDWKVIYPDMEAALSAAREMEALGGDPQYAYSCGRSRNGHAHLTRTPQDEGEVAARSA